MEQEFTETRPANIQSAAIKATRMLLLIFVWVPFLGSNYLTITHLTTWTKTDHWPIYSTANLFSDLRFTTPKGAGFGMQPFIDWIMSAPAAYSMMGMAIILSITLALFPDA